MNRFLIPFFVLLLLLSFVATGCTNSSNMSADEQVDPKIYQMGETLQFRNEMDFKLQESSLLSSIKLNSLNDTIYSLPHIYFNPKQKSIIHVLEENTIYTEIETSNSNTYEVAYIVEKKDTGKATNAPYCIDFDHHTLHPMSHDKSFFVAVFSIKNTGKTTIDLGDLELTIEMEDGSIKTFDNLLAQTIFIDAPAKIKPNETSSFRWITTVPAQTQSLLVDVNGRKIEWKKQDYPL